MNKAELYNKIQSAILCSMKLSKAIEVREWMDEYAKLYADEQSREEAERAWDEGMMQAYLDVQADGGHTPLKFDEWWKSKEEKK